MNNIILYSPCRFTALAIRRMASKLYSSHGNVIQCSDFSNLLVHIDTVKNNNRLVIIIDMNSKSAHWKANYLCTLWNVRRIANRNKRIKAISFLALGDTQQKSPPFLQHIPLLREINLLEHALSRVFQYEENYILKPIKNDIKIKVFLIFAITKGLNNTQIAIILNVSVKSVRNRQEALMREIGLRKRYEFAFLCGKVYRVSRHTNGH
ncbi:hypothetical protein OE847_003721 [Salmonella enterica]|nr:hypothetical protein [Salmonella enterica]EDX0904537.1 hypothetical protein [Salmonella enterica subsp. enterica]EFS2847487.1 hypothetical protein [Salmonella enterica]EJY0498336.1 hypothetical protein [Salmonella enterica]EKM5284657.1 hypothetical protein [Salmonella enterica]